MVDALLAEIPFRETVLRQILKNPATDAYDYIFFDMSSRFASLLLNALVASDYVVIPVQPQEWSYDGITKMMANIQAVKKSANASLEVAGILLNMCNRTVLSKSVVGAVKEKYPDQVLKTEFPTLVEVPESQNARQSLVNTTFSKTGKLYVQCAKELMNREMEDKARKVGITIR
jgi:chromosome partitioning protein